MSLKSGHRQALLNNLVIGLIKNNRIQTTHKKAKAASQFADKLITLAKRKDVHAQRQLYVYLKSRELVKKLVDEIAPRFEGRSGGYTRVLKFKNRRGDNALMSILEFTELPEKVELDKKGKAKDAKKVAAKKSEKADKKDLAHDDDADLIEKRSKKSGFFSNLRGYLKK